MRIDAISIGVDPPREVNVIIEVPVGGEPIKYEMDKEAGTLVVDRFLYTSMRYPGNYGFIPHTLSGDGDPLDVLVANQRGIHGNVFVDFRAVDLDVDLACALGISSQVTGNAVIETHANGD